MLPANTGGELLVTIQESDGRIRRFTVPYSSVPQLLKPGVSRYGITLGTVNEDNYDKDPFAAQAYWQYGLNNYLTLYTGASGFERYQSALIGSGLNSQLGAFALDVTQSRLNLGGRSPTRTTISSDMESHSPLVRNLVLAGS